MSKFTRQVWTQLLGDNWFERNRQDLGQRGDLVAEVIKAIDLKPEMVLEVGCGNGWRLKQLHKQYGCRIFGIDPSSQAIAEASKELGEYGDFLIGTADRLPINENECFDVVILGFCMCLIPPDEWFQVVAETSRVLRDDGHLIILDYLTPRPFRREYCKVNDQSVWMHFMNFEQLWLGHPGYRKVREMTSTPRWEAATVLHKNFTLPTLPQGSGLGKDGIK